MQIWRVIVDGLVLLYSAGDTGAFSTETRLWIQSAGNWSSSTSLMCSFVYTMACQQLRLRGIVSTAKLISFVSDKVNQPRYRHFPASSAPPKWGKSPQAKSTFPI